MGTANQQPGPDIRTAASNELGIDMTLSGGAYADPNDLPVFTGRYRGGPRRTIGPGPAPQFQTTREKRQSELEKEFYAQDPKDLSALQHRLWAGGFYAQGVDPEEIALGDYDEQTFAAYSKAVQRAARFYATGQELTVDEVIDMATGLEGAGAARAKGAGGGRQPLVTELTNPEDLKYVAQKTAVSALGRALRPDELERFVTSFHASQSTASAAAYGAAGGAGGAVVSPPSAQAAAEAFARREAPVEAGAHDVVRVFDVFSKMIGRRG